MAGKSNRLESREARKKLPSSPDPHWRSVGKGIAVGYRKPAKGPATWYVRRFNGTHYSKEAIGETDDEHPADGIRLSWSDALRQAIDTPKREAHHKHSYSVSAAFEDYFHERTAQRNSTGSLETDRYRVAGFIEKFGDTPVADLTTGTLKRWRQGLVVMPADCDMTEAQQREAKRAKQATANRLWSIVLAALNHAFQSGNVDSDIEWRRVKKFAKVDAPRLRFLSVEEAKRLLKHCDDTFKPLVHAALLTGLRLGELVRLTVGDVGKTSIEVAASKNGMRRNVPLVPEAVKLFAQLTKGRDATETLLLDGSGHPWHKMMVSRRMRAVSKEAKLEPPARFHDLRRSFGSLLANAGARDSIIAAALGHQDVRMTRRHYAHLLDKAVAAEITDKLPSFSGKAPARKRAKVK